MEANTFATFATSGGEPKEAHRIPLVRYLWFATKGSEANPNTFAHLFALESSWFATKGSFATVGGEGSELSYIFDEFATVGGEAIPRR